jgi:hypothetical protein
LKKLGLAVNRIARHADKLAVALGRLKSVSPAPRSARRRAQTTRPKKK